MRKIKSWIQRGTLVQYALVGLLAVTMASAAASSLHHSGNKPHTIKQTTYTASIRKETQTETVEVPYGKATVEDPTYTPGYSEVTASGQNGTKVITYEVTYTDGILTRKKPIKEEITVPPVNEVTSVAPFAVGVDTLEQNDAPVDCNPDDGSC